MSITGSAAGRASLQYFNGSNYVELQTPSGANALTDLTITDTLGNPVFLQATLINRPADPRSGTASSTTGNLTGILTEFMKIRCIDAYSKQVIFSGWIYDLDENYTLKSGSTLTLEAYDNLAELRDYKTDNMVKIDTSQSTHNSRSEVIQELIKRSSKDNIATSDSNQFEASTQTFAANMLGDLTPKDAGKNVLNAIKHLAQTEPIDAANQNHSFGNDFYLASQFTSTATSATQTPMLNYFKRGSRPMPSGSDMDTFGMKIQFPLSSSDTETGQTRNMLPDYDFKRDRASVHSDVHVKFNDRGGAGKASGSDTPSAGQTRKMNPLQLTRLNMTAINGQFNYLGSPIAGDLSVNGQFVYSNTKDGYIHNFSASKIHTNSQGATSTKVLDVEPSADWLVRIGASDQQIEAEANTASANSHKFGWLRFNNVPENDDSNSVPGGKMRIAGLSLSGKELTVTTSTNHFMQAGDRIMMQGLNLGTGSGAVRKNAQLYKKSGGSRVISREGQLGTLHYQVSTNKTDDLANGISDDLISVDKEHGLKVSGGATNVYGSYAFLEDENVEILEIFNSMPDSGSGTSELPSGNHNLAQTNSAIRHLDNRDILEVVRGKLGTTQVQHQVQNGAANTDAGRHSPVPLFAAPRETSLYDQEGGCGGLWKTNIFRIDRIVSDTQFVIEVITEGITFSGGLLTVGFLDKPDSDGGDGVDDSGINSSVTQFNIDVNDGSNDRLTRPHLAVGMIIKMDSEEMLITAVGSVGSSGDKYQTQVTVTRGHNGTTAASHNDNVAVTTMVAHVIPVIGRVQHQTTTSSVTAGEDFIIISDQAKNTPTTGNFRLYGLQSGKYATFNSSTTAVSHRDSFGLNKPLFMTINQMNRLPDSIRGAFAEALGDGSFEETRAGTVRINNFAYQFIDGHVSAVASSGTVVTTKNFANSASINPLSYGLRVGMTVWKLTSATDLTRAAYGYVSAVSSSSFTVTLNSGVFAADDKFRMFIPLRPGHLVQLKNKLLKIDTTSANTFGDNQTDYVVNQVKYVEQPGAQQSSISVVKQEGTVDSPGNVYKSIQSATDDNAFSSFEDTLVNPATASTDIKILAGTSAQVAQSLEPSATDGSNLEGDLFFRGRAIHWTSGILRVDGEEYEIPEGNSTDGGDLDGTTLAVGSSALFLVTDQKGEIDEDTGQNINNPTGRLNPSAFNQLSGYSDTTYVLFADLKQSKFMVTKYSTFESNVKDKGSKLIVGIALGATTAAANNAGHDASFKWNILNEKANRMDVKGELSQFVGHGYGKGTATSPVVTFDADTTTGIFSSTDGAIDLTNNGTHTFTFEKDGSDNSFITVPAQMKTGTGTNVIIDSSHEILKSSSSAKYKENIEPVEIDSEKLLSLQAKTYNFKSQSPAQKDIGLIAEDVHEQIPELIWYDENGDPDSVKYQALTVLLLEEVKKLKKQIEELQDGS